MIHIHTIDCIKEDITDLGDDGDGYEAYSDFTCDVTGESHKSIKEFE